MAYLCRPTKLTGYQSSAAASLHTQAGDRSYSPPFSLYHRLFIRHRHQDRSAPPQGMYSQISPLCLLLSAARCLALPVDPLPSSSSLHNHGRLANEIQSNFAEPPRLPIIPTGEGQGWLARWLSMGGEGVVTVCVSIRSLSLSPIESYHN